MKAAASGTREKMTAGAAGNKNEATAAGTKGGMTAGAAGARKSCCRNQSSMIAGAAGFSKIIKARTLKAAAAGNTKSITARAAGKRKLMKAAASGNDRNGMTAGAAGNKKEAVGGMTAEAACRCQKNQYGSC